MTGTLFAIGTGTPSVTGALAVAAALVAWAALTAVGRWWRGDDELRAALLAVADRVPAGVEDEAADPWGRVTVDLTLAEARAVLAAARRAGGG